MAAHVGERFTNRPVKRQADFGRHGARRALHLERYLQTEVAPVVLDKLGQPLDRCEVVVAQGSYGIPSPHHALFGEPSGAVDHGAQRCTDAFVGGELARSLELDGQPRKRVGQYVVQFSRYAGAFGPRRGTGLVVPGVFELGEEQLGAVLAHPGLLHECPENGKHDAEEDRTGDGLGVGVRAEGDPEARSDGEDHHCRGRRPEGDGRH